jgi:hypothetical protein
MRYFCTGAMDLQQALNWFCKGFLYSSPAETNFIDIKGWGSFKYSTEFLAAKHYSCSATTRMGPRNKTHVACVSSAWFIFNLNTESYYLQIIYHNIYTSDNIQSSSTPCSLLSPSYLRGEPASLLMVRIPIQAYPWSANNCPTLTSSPTLSHPTDQVTIFT